MDDILQHVHTTLDRDELKKIIVLLLASLFQEKKSFQEQLEGVVGISWKARLTDFFAKEGVALSDRARIEEKLTRLQKMLESLPVVRLTLAFDPPTHAIEAIASWLQATIRKPVVLDITQDHTILGGARIEFEGRYLDGSLRSKLEKVFEEGREGLGGLGELGRLGKQV